MKKVIVLFLLALAMIPVQLTAQVNPQKGYIITNSGDTVHGTIDYLTDVYQGDGEIDTLSRTRNLSRNTMS